MAHTPEPASTVDEPTPESAPTPDAQRSREELLRVLLDTATDITALRDVEAVLQAIVRRTRAIVATDMAYLALTDVEAGVTAIRHSEGVATHAYRTLQQPLGTGVLGEVARGLAPFHSSDYLRDEALVHVPEIDEIVRAEGVRSIMGVPLTVAGRVMGALVVAERHPRSFTPQEIALVDSLGKIAAVALDNSMRFEAAGRLAEDLVRQQQRSAAELALITQVLELDDRLMDAVMVTPDVGRILAIGQSVLACDLWLRDPDGAVLTATTSHGPPAEPGSTVAVTAAGERLGLLASARTLDAPALALLERVAVHVSLALLFARAEEDADLRLQSQVLDDLLERTDVPRERLERRLQRWGLQPGEPLWSVVIEAPEADRRRRLQAVRSLGTRSVMMATHHDHVCLVTADPTWEQSLRTLFAARGWRLRAGIGGPTADVRQLGDAHRRAQLALGSLTTLGRDGVLDGAELGLLGALLDLAGRGELPQSLTAAIDPLRDYDRTRDADLTRTAYVYLESDGNVARVADILHLHRNTVRQRLERIGALLGPGWDASPRRLETHLALRVLEAERG
ncbi:helix-turn-helix domain-containing protein [Microbacterium sp. NPDC096154]|uniref:helix-turn-helix domain-containing protein n=1 Tax=Microbacterium sp. NPDC096154 TaxID=3155549 RepID=UPI00332A7354